MAIQNGPGALAGATEAEGKITNRRFNASTGEQAAARSGPRARSRYCRRGRPIDFVLISRAALAVLPQLLQRWLPGGQIVGAEYVVRNPTRHDQRPGSFKVNLRTGQWSDFAIGTKGGDPISLGAYLAGCGQVEAARRLAAMLGIGGRDGR